MTEKLCTTTVVLQSWAYVHFLSRAFCQSVHILRSVFSGGRRFAFGKAQTVCEFASVRFLRVVFDFSP